MQELIDKGVLRPSGEIVKDKINLISGAHTPPFVDGDKRRHGHHQPPV